MSRLKTVGLLRRPCPVHVMGRTRRRRKRAQHERRQHDAHVSSHYAQEQVPAGRAPVLFHHAEREMGGSW
jgi:hypothetical protein